MNPLDRLWLTLSDRVAYHIEEGLRYGVSPLAPYLRRLGTGTLLILLSGAGWALCLLFLLLAFFFALSPLPGFTAASLWTSLVGFLAGLILLLCGLGMVRKPRRSY